MGSRARLIALGLVAGVAGVACGGRAAAPAGSTTAGAATAGDGSPADRAIEAILARADKAGTFAGVVVATRGGRTIHASARGVADPRTGTPHRLDELFRYASITKQVTALLVMQEVAAGRVELDRAITTYLPELGPAVAPVTVRDLLRHTSGLPNLDGDDADAALPAAYAARPAPPVAAVLAGPCRPRATVTTGTFAYNNCDYRVLEALLERVTGAPYGALVTDRVAAPLGLASWGLYPPDGRDPTPVRGVLADGGPEPAYNLASYGGAGALYGSARDLARWGQALLDHALLDPARTAIMFTGDPLYSMAALGSWAYDTEMSRARPPGTIAIVERQGAIGGVRTAIFLSPSHGLVVVLLSNTAATEFEGVWSGAGLGYDLVAAAAAAGTGSGVLSPRDPI